MSISVECAKCGARFQAREELAGRRGKCPKCGAAIEVPSLAASPARSTGTSPPSVRGVAPVSAASRRVDGPHVATTSPAQQQRATRPAKPTVADPAAARQEILEALVGHIEPVPTSAAYKASVALVAGVMLLLPVVYVGIIVGVGYLLYLHAVYSTRLFGAAGEPAHVNLGTLIAYLGPLVAGVILILFMCKPLFARGARREKPRSLTRKGEPLLFEFVERLTAVVGAPCPKRIDVDCQVNAAAGFRRGVLSMASRNDMVLVLGLPLVAGMSLQQFAGVLAHEFGHFTQGWGMRLSYIIRSVNYWFHRVVYERDEWDQRLVNWSNAWDWRVSIVLYVARLGVWLTRKVLFGLMIAGHAVSGILLRQMEFDADLHETRLAGSEAFESTCRRLAVLNVATSGAFADLRSWYRDGRLGDDLPRLILANVDQMPGEVHLLINQQIDASKTGWFDTHPSDSERIARARQEGAAGLFHDERPAASLFANFAALSKTVTFDCYKSLLGSALKITDLHPTEKLVARQEMENAAARAMSRYFQNAFSVRRPLPFATGWLEKPADPDVCRARLRQARQEATQAAAESVKAYAEFAAAADQIDECDRATALLQAKFKIKPNLFSRPLTSNAQIKQARAEAQARMKRIAASLEPYEAAAAARMTAAIELLYVDEVAAKLSDGGQLPERCRQLLTSVVAINRAIPSLVELEGAHGACLVLVHLLEGREQDEDLVGAILERMKALYRLIDEVRERLGTADYPFKHSRGKISIAAYCTETKPLADDLGGLLNAASDILDRLPALVVRLMAQLAVAAENVERAVGLPPLETPQPKEG